MDYHTVYKGPEGETTEWEDLQVKHGNLAPRAPKWKPDEWEAAKEEVKDKEWVDKKDEEGLEEAEDEFSDDRFMEEYRRKRIAQIQASRNKPRFGTLEFIKANEFVQKVSNAPENVWVVVLLKKDGHAKCELLKDCLSDVAKRFHGTKFVEMKSTDCIPNFPDENLPTILLYKNKKCEETLQGLGMFGGRHCSTDQVAFTLNRFGPICVTDGEDYSQEPTVDQLKGLVERMVMQREESDEDSDFD